MKEKTKSKAVSYAVVISGLFLLVALTAYVYGYFWLTDTNVYRGSKYRVFPGPRSLWYYKPLVTVEGWVLGIDVRSTIKPAEGRREVFY